MAFNPTSGAYYYLVAAHSNKVLEIQGDSNQPGALVQQAAIKPFLRSNYQQFGFERSGDPRIFTIKCKGSDLILDVKGSLQDDMAPILQYTRRGSDNQRFRVVDANDGSFYIEAVHSGKVIEIYGEEMRDGMPAKQFNNHHTDKNQHQRFYFVLAEEGFTEKNLPTFSKPNQIVREATLGIIKLGPNGGAVSGVVALFWPDPSLSIVYNQLVKYIETYVDNRLEKIRLTTLQEAIAGARLNLREFVTLNNSPEKAAKLTSTISTLNQVDRQFFNPSSPEQTLTYLVTIGTIKLALLREQANCYAEISGSTGVDPNHATHVASLLAGLEEYTIAAQTFRDRALEARLDKVGNNTKTLQHTFSYHNWAFDVSLRDGGDDSVTTIRFGNEYAEPGGKEAAIACVVKKRKDILRAQFGAQLDAIIEPARLWKKLDPASKDLDKVEEKEIISASIGPYGTPYEEIELLDGDQIKKIEIWSDALIDKGNPIKRVAGVRISGPSGQSKTVGHQRGSYHQIELKEGERIVGVYGSASYYLHALCFETNLGARLLAGDLNRGDRFQADLPPELRGHLAGISASSTADGISSIKFNWHYGLLGAWPKAPTLQVQE